MIFAHASAAQAQAYVFTTLTSFNDDDRHPHPGVTLDRSGNLYGTAYEGIAHEYSTIFKIVTKTNEVTTLASFNGTNGHFSDDNGVTVDVSGNLYGTTSNGGAGNYGTVFKIMAGTNNPILITTFDGLSGMGPSSLTIDGNGNLYGTAQAGGSKSGGTVYKISAGTNTIIPLAPITNFGAPASTCVQPNGNPVLDRNGNLYGTVYDGGANDYGTVFKVAAGMNTLTTLVTFNSANGAFPMAGLTVDGNDNIYGTTSAGGASHVGTVFKIAAGTGKFTTIATFRGSNGRLPRGGLTLDSRGNLYGTTSGGGPGDYGTVFKIATGTGALTTIATFKRERGWSPQGKLAIDGKGNLYGTTEEGGTGEHGTVFRLTPEISAGNL